MKQDSSVSQQSSTLISISVTQPQLHKQYVGTIQYLTFTLKGNDNKGFINIERKSSDFELLRVNLLKRWPGIFIPIIPLSPKNIQSKQKLEEISHEYELFLLEISTREYIWYGEMFQFFLKHSTMSCQKVLNSFGNHSFQQILYQYRTNFKIQPAPEEEKTLYFIDQFDKQSALILETFSQIKSNGRQDLLGAQSKGIKKYTKIMKEFGKQKKQQTDNQSNLNRQEESMMGMISEYKINENESHRSHKQNFSYDIFLTELDCLLKFNSQEHFWEDFKKQMRVISSFREVLENRKQLIKKRDKKKQKIQNHENKIDSLAEGKQSFLSKLKKSSIATQIKDHEQSLQKCRSEYSQYCQLCTLVDNVMLGEIKKFKESRIQAYYRLIKKIAEEESKQVKQQHQFWVKVQEGKIFSFQLQKLPVKEGKVEERTDDI